MDTLNHATQGFLMGYLVTHNIPISVATGIIATVPDLIGEWKARDGDWTWYNDVHNFKHWLSFIPPITLHVALDKLGHGEGKRWYAEKWYNYFNPFKYKEAMWLETITWIINLIAIFLIIKL